jgi:hypothetical protein
MSCWSSENQSIHTSPRRADETLKQSTRPIKKASFVDIFENVLDVLGG